jgi:hypothetical protein
MLYICYGMPKSASSFICQLAIDIAQSHSDQNRLLLGLPSHLQGDFFHNDLEHKLPDFCAAIPEQAIYVIKTHDPLTEALKAELQAGRARAIASYRNPYDIAVSLKDAGVRERKSPLSQQRPFFVNIRNDKDALIQIPYHLKCARSWLTFAQSQENAGSVLAFAFEQIVHDTHRVAEAIATHMGITSDISAIDISAIVTPYQINQQKILEFNVGRSGRGMQELDLAKIPTYLENNINEFVNEFLSAAPTHDC